MPVIAFEPHRFRSTADYYSRYRIPYPPALIAAVAARLQLRPGSRVLDLGCGPGPLALGFARIGMAVTGMDPEPEMLAAAGAAAMEEGLDIAFGEGSSYDLGSGLGRFSLVTMGRSFHWMDRTATLAALDGMVEPAGAVALFHDGRIAASPDWSPLLADLTERFSPDGAESRRIRRADDWLPHEAVLLDSSFSAVEKIGRVFAQQLTTDDIVGRAYSMSVTSPNALGERQSEFEAALRAGLAELSPDDRFAEIVEATAILAFRAER